ncbi:uncharacterized protein [Pyrus communis]|uniref:uncharacterized protein n=1 Tax=Pyrus communis TaxID=23211 RepID=UPI0035BEE524
MCMTNIKESLFPIERRPRMLLKDFLGENSNSCSSSGFISFPRQLPSNPSNAPKTQNSCSENTTTISRKLLRSRSRAAWTTISAFHSLMNAVKNMPFTAVKPPSFLPRSLSRRLLQSKQNSPRSSRKQGSQSQVQITVRVKDIIRWTSFRDEKLPPPPPLDYVSSPLHCTSSTTITGSTTTCTTCSSNSSSNGSSWCDSDFTSEFLQPWGGNSDPDYQEDSKKYSPCVGRDSMEATSGTGSYAALGPKVELPLCDEEDEQHSPVSVIGFQFGEDEDSSFSSNFDQSLANMERTKEMLMQKIKLFESLVTVDPINLDTSMSFEERTNFEEDDETAERAMELLNHCKASCSDLKSWELELVEDQLLFDFFREEMSAQRNKKEDGFNREMISKARAWMSGDWGSLEHNKEACVRDMHEGRRWNKFEFEQEELGLEIEIALSEYLVDELLLDLLSR